MSDRSFEGEPVDLTYQHLSERSNGQTVAGTTDDDLGEETTDIWPSEAPPREELNETQIAVIEAAADPTREWDSLYELSRSATPDMSEHYASSVLSAHWPAKNDEIRDDASVPTNGELDYQRTIPDSSDADGDGADETEGGGVDADLFTADELDEVFADGAASTSEQPISDSSRLQTALAAIVGFVLGWVIGR